MSFINPTLIWGLLFAALPVLIYFLIRHKWKAVEWGAMQIILEILEEQKRRMRLLEIILLVVRTLMLAFLAMALARPLFTDQISATLLGADGDVLIMIDGSYSMQTGQGTGTRFDQAKQEALAILEDTPSGFGVSLVLASEQPDPILATYSADHGLAAETIRNLEPTDLAGDAAATIGEAKRLLEASQKGIKRCFLISDFQLRDWASSEESFLASIEELAQNAELTLVPITDGLVENVAVTEVQLAAGAVRTGSQAVITAELANHGQSDASDVPVDLLVDGVVMESATVHIPAQGAVTVRFPYVAIEPGAHGATVRIRHDNLLADNERHLPFEAVDAVAVLAVVDDDVPLAGAQSTDFIELCLNPYPDRGADSRAVYDFTTINAADLLAEDLNAYELIIFSQVAAPNELQVEMLESYMRGGGGVLVFLDEDTDVALWNQRFHRDGAGMLPWPLQEDLISEADENDAMVFVPTAEGHPVWRDLVGGSTDYFAGVRFYTSWVFEPTGGERALVLGGVRPSHLPEARPMLLDSSLGRGHAIIMGSSADLSMNNFAVRKVYVGFVNQAVSYLRSFRAGDSMVRTGTAATRYVDFQRSQATYRITTPDDEERGASVEARGDEYVLAMPALMQAGFYELVNQEDPNDRSLIAANVDPGEGLITSMGVVELDQSFADTGSTVAGAEADGPEGASALGGAEIATFLLVLVLACWLGENLLAHRIATV
ncbi:MAG: BatA domain-containing protein [Planctomycetota bacterium]